LGYPTSTPNELFIAHSFLYVEGWKHSQYTDSHLSAVLRRCAIDSFRSFCWLPFRTRSYPTEETTSFCMHVCLFCSWKCLRRFSYITVNNHMQFTYRTWYSPLDIPVLVLIGNASIRHTYFIRISVHILFQIRLALQIDKKMFAGR